MRRLLFAAAFSLLILSPELGEAQIEVTSNMALGGGVVLVDADSLEADQTLDASQGVFRMGLNSSITFLRESNREFGLGLYAEVMTSTFRDVMPGLGVSFLFPVHRDMPLILWAGAHYDFDGEHAAGFGGRLWWGAHNHNHFRVYNPSFGLWVEVRANVWGNQDVLIAGGVELDLQVLITPWLWFASWVRGPAREREAPEEQASEEP